MNQPINTDDVLKIQGLDLAEAKAALESIIKTKELEARIDELELFFKQASHYPIDRAYEREPFYTITDSELTERLTSLRQELK